MLRVVAMGRTHSLAMATSVGAKPNHGFFHCQQPRRIFLRAGRAAFARRRVTRAKRAMHRRIACVMTRMHPRTRSQKNTCFKGFRATTPMRRIGVVAMQRLRCNAITDVRHGVRRPCDGPSCSLQESVSAIARVAQPEMRETAQREIPRRATTRSRTVGRMRLLSVDTPSGGCRTRRRQWSSSSSSSA